jgi:hypothetical protein
MRALSHLACFAGIVTASFLACGGGTNTAAGPEAAPLRSEAGSSESTLPEGSARKRLQGNWEIVRYESKRIPNEAMPLMAELFESLRLRYEGSSAIVQRGKGPDERTSFEVADEQGDAFRLIDKGGMFDGSRCRFINNDEWEAADDDSTWPGTTRLHRAR